MNEHQDDLDINKNLKILCESSNTSEFDLTNFINKNGRKMHSSNESEKFTELMVREGLIRVFGDFCALEKKGFEIFNSGGWLNYLSNQEKQESELELKQKENETLDRDIKLLQKDKLIYNETIREQKNRIRNLTEELKFISLIQKYWWFIGACLGLGWFLGEILKKIELI